MSISPGIVSDTPRASQRQRLAASSCLTLCHCATPFGYFDFRMIYTTVPDQISEIYVRLRPSFVTVEDNALDVDTVNWHSCQLHHTFPSFLLLKHLTSTSAFPRRTIDLKAGHQTRASCLREWLADDQHTAAEPHTCTATAEPSVLQPDKPRDSRGEIEYGLVNQG